MSDSKKKNSIPIPTLRRLPKYYNYLLNKKRQENKYISCTDIAEFTGFKKIQVRKDLQMAGAVGKPKIGYEIDILINTLENFLGYNNITDAFLVGVGSMGTALLKHESFKKHGVSIVAAFDSDENLIGTKVNDIHILDINNFENLSKRMNIKVGIVAVPENKAQEICDLMVGVGFKGILNLCSTTLKAPSHVTVQNENIGIAMSILVSKL